MHFHLQFLPLDPAKESLRYARSLRCRGCFDSQRYRVVAQGFLQWRENRAARADAPWLSEGYVAPHEARLGGGTLLSVAAIGLASLWMIWGNVMVMRVIIASGIWLCLPAWVLHLAMGRPEPRS